MLQNNKKKAGGLLSDRKEYRVADTVHTLAANLNRLMEKERERGSALGSNEGLAEAAKVSSNTIGRMRRGDGAASILNVAKVAKVLKVTAWEMLYPAFDPATPTEIARNPAERQLLQAFRAQPGPTTH